VKRIGIVLWAAGWAYLLLSGASLPTPLSRECLLILGLASFVAVWGRVAEAVFLAGAIWPVFFPGQAARIVLATLLTGTLLQAGVWTFRWGVRMRDARRRWVERRDAWRYDPDEEPLFTRAGDPLNAAAWRRLTPEEFEAEVLALFKAHGYAGELTSLSGDEGIDLMLRGEGRYVVVQCKHYLKPVGQPPLRDFAGAMRASGADAGYFVTTSGFSDPAVRWAESLGEPRIVLVDGPALVRWTQDGVFPE
jgi:hypothetical protein